MTSFQDGISEKELEMELKDGSQAISLKKFIRLTSGREI